MTENDPLDDLYTSESPFDSQRLADSLAPYVNVDPQTGAPNVTTEFNESGGQTQAVALLLYRRAANEMGELDEPVPVTQGWAEEEFPRLDIPIVDMDRDLPFVDCVDGAYHIPKHLIDDAVDWLS